MKMTAAMPMALSAKITLPNDNVPKYRHKFLGGALSTSGLIVAIPAHSKHVLTIEPGPHPNNMARLGINEVSSCVIQKYKWLRGVPVGADIFGIPCWANEVLRVDTSTGSVSTFGDLRNDTAGIGHWGWHGGAFSPDGKIYGVPCNALRVLEIDPKTKTARTVGPILDGKNKWYGGILDKDGAVVCVPFNARSILKIRPGGEVELVGDFSDAPYKWHGGVRCADSSAIYGFPSHTDRVLKITSQGAELIGPSLPPKINNGKYKYGGGSNAADGTILGIPSDCDTILRIDPRTDEVTTFGQLSDEKNKWQGAVTARNGITYGIPCNSGGVLRINPFTEEVSVIGELPPGEDKYQGGVLAGDGCIYCIPENAARVLKIIPGEDGRVDELILL
jgi:hypothetical protein